MSQISKQDQSLIKLIKLAVEKVSGLENSKSWAQKDYEFLIHFIEKKTSISLSLSTIKRIWKDENSRLPHISTLNALSQVAYQKDWLSLKTDVADHGSGAEPIFIPEHDENQKAFRSFNFYAQYAIVLFFLVMLSYLTYSYFSNYTGALNTEGVKFSSRTSVENKIPNTVVFDYDVSNVNAEKFYIQQNWDARRRVEILKENNEQTDIYYLPGFYFAKLFADTTLVSQTPVHIKLDDWFVQTFQGTKSEAHDKTVWLNDGNLGLSINKVSEDKINKKEPYSVAFYNSRDFNTDGDNFSLHSKFKMDSIGTMSCPKMSIIVKGEHDYFLIQLIKNGCESDAMLKLREKQISGKTNDLTSLGTNLYQWTDFIIDVKDTSLSLILNGKRIYQNNYSDAIGSLKEISYIFSNNGILGEVELKNVAGEVTYKDDFKLDLK